MNVRPVHGGMAPRSPARALLQARCMRGIANVNLSRLPLHLRVTFQTEIGIALHEHFAIDRAVRCVADDAAFPQCFMFENKWPGLLAVTLAAILVLPRHRQSTLRFENVLAMRVVALNAIHVSLVD